MMDLRVTTPTPANMFDGGLGRHLDAHCIWIVSPAGYPHARCFDEVAIALSEGLEALGGSAPIVRDRKDWHGRTPIVLGANLLAASGGPALPPGAIVYNLEQVDGASRWFDESYLRLLANSTVLDYSERNRSILARWGVPSELLEVGWSPALERVPARRTDHVDVCFYGSINPRRAALLDELERRGLLVERLFGVYGPERDAAIARAKVVLNVHFYEASVFEIVRISYLLGNGVCVVSEGDPADPEIAPFADGIAIASYEGLADAVEALVVDPDRRAALGSAGAAAMRARPQAGAWARLFERDVQSTRGMTARDEPTSGRLHGLRGVTSATLLSPTTDPRSARPLRQLADALAANGVRADVVPIDADSTIERHGLVCTIAAPGSARERIDVPYRDDHLVVVPDTLADHALTFVPFRTAVWWLRVDDIVGPGGPLADPECLDAVLASTGIVHLHRGAYTREFLRSRGVSAISIGDHVDHPDAPDRHGPNPSLAVAVGPDAAAASLLSTSSSGLPTVAIDEDLDTVDATLGDCVCFVHTGPLTGRHGLPRLAALLGAVVFVPNTGAGRYHEDVGVPDAFRYEPDELASGALALRVRAVMASPQRAWDEQRPYRDRVRDEHTDLPRDIGRLLAR